MWSSSLSKRSYFFKPAGQKLLLCVISCWFHHLFHCCPEKFGQSTVDLQVWSFTCPEKMPQRPMMTRTLKTADPTIVPTPTSPFVINTPQNIEQERVRFYLPLIHRSVQSYTYYLFHLNKNNNIITSLDRNLGNVLCVSATDCDAFSA